MTCKKYEIEINTLKNFYEIYCKGKHDYREDKKYNLEYKNEKFTLELHICKECQENIEYSFDRLQTCPHEIKPRCRRCPNPCYEKDRWKHTAKVMKYSGVRLGLINAKQSIKKLFS